VRFTIRLLLLMGLLLSATSLSPLATAEPSRSPSPSGDRAATRTPPARVPAGSSARKKPRASVPAPPVRITSSGSLRSLQPTTVGRAAFRYSAARVPGLRFQCKLNGPGQSGVWRQNCPSRTTGDTVSGMVTYRRLRANPLPYTFTVQAYVPASPGIPRSEGRPAAFSWYLYSLVTRDHFVPPAGVHFNRPLGNRESMRSNLTYVIRMVNSMPGYRQPAESGSPCRGVSLSRIRISLYSLTDQPVAKALVNAAKRCVSVQVLMNNHLTSANDPAWHRLQSALHANVRSRGVDRPSFAHRCSYGCQGRGVLHTKMYLFDSNVPAPNGSWNKIVKTVVVGSSNMTFNAAKVQWNDLYTVRNNPRLFSQYQIQFARMKRDNGFHRTRGPVTTGIYQTTFWPTRVGPDPYMSALRSIHCTGARGAGVQGRSIVYINMHAWFNSRGLALARQVRSMYNHGCYVRVLYSFMSFGVFKILHKGTGARMSVRRTLFSHNGKTAYLYSHFKNIAASGYIGRSRSAHVAWTGSNNFTNEGVHFDEVMMRIASTSAYNGYVKQYSYIRERKSSATYANFSEPSGGGRAPGQSPAVQLRSGLGAPSADQAPAGTPTIVSPAVRIDSNGTPHALD
jgi:HKD family nuclease